MEVCVHTVRVSQQRRVRCQLVSMSILNVMIIYSPSCRPSVCLRTCLNRCTGSVSFTVYRCVQLFKRTRKRGRPGTEASSM